ncbi:uncharacterized protein LOC125941079 [Dermacentor silvarum]|uniref:uncharacterized protein LOC125941079 n=1 Tax=Dermacentor silvarum TaxID=543639 RepID=UPI0021006D2F|nr:uncharacterized protein LOC125941079 [Dermacentor silvarum]
MIDITPHRSTPDSVLDSIRVFKEFHKLLKRYAEGKNQRTLTFFGYTPLSQEWIDLIPSILSIFTPDIFVFHGHNSLVQRKWNSSCTILPQNAVIDMPGLPISLTTAHKTLSEVAEEQHTPAWAVSVTAAGRWNRPKNAANQDDYKLLKECIRPPRNFTKFGSITEVCNNPNYVRLEDKDDHSGYAYSLQDGLIMTYDTSDMLRQKLCRQKANLTHIDYGIAVFDLEYEDDSDLCPSGSYSHIKMARALAEFFESKYNTASDLTDCLRGENK